MKSEAKPKNHFLYKQVKSTPLGKIKLAMALEELLDKKNFSEITTTEISKISGVNESLIYRYFQDKKGLLYYVLAEHQKESMQGFYSDLVTITGAVNKLKRLIKRTINNWDKDRVHAKIILIEAKSSPGYYESETYFIVKEYCHLIRSLVQEGINNGEIRKEVSPWFLMQVILGSIEYVVLPTLIFDRKIDVDVFTDNLFDIIFNKVLTENSSAPE